MSRAREAVRRMRRDLHKDRAVPALYIAVPNATPVPCTVRVHDKFEALGSPAGGSINGFAKVQNDTPRIIFMRDDAPPMLRHGAIVSVEVGEAYRIDNTDPAHDITITATVTKLSPGETVGLPVPDAASTSSIAPATFSGGIGLGTIDYTDLDEGTPLVLPANQWVKVARNLVPSAANFNLPRGPWKDFAFWRDGKLWARAKGDSYIIKFYYEVTPSMRGASLRLAVRPGGDPNFDFGPSSLLLDVDAGQTLGNSTTFYEQARSRFVQQGAEIFAMMSADGVLTKFSPEIVILGGAA